MKNLSTQVILIIALVLLVGFVIIAGPSACSRMRSMAAQARVDAAQGQAQANSSADAINTVSRSGEAQAASEDLTRTNEKEIRNADGANDRVKAGVNSAGLRALCLRNAYRDSERCRVFRADPK